MKRLYAKVIVDISHEKLDRPFTYIVPSKLLGVIEEGDRVQIPFGAGNKIISGYVIELTDKSEYDISKLKEISAFILALSLVSCASQPETVLTEVTLQNHAPKAEISETVQETTEDKENIIIKLKHERR